jgi:hypothetical protein
MTKTRQRLEARLNRLRKWERDGAPAEVFVPRSQNELITWHAPELGIERIGDRNACTTGHRQNGATIRECIQLIASINGRPKRARPGSESTNKRLRSEKRLLEDQLTNVTCQWHTARAEADRERRERKGLERQLADALDELADWKRKALTVVHLKP